MELDKLPICTYLQKNEYLWAMRPIILITPCPEEWDELLPEEEHIVIKNGENENIVQGLHCLIERWQRNNVKDCRNYNSFDAEDATLKIIKLASNTTAHV